MLLIFDWDGTLINSMDKIIRCMHAAIEEVQLPSRASEQVQNIIGLGLKEGISLLFEGIDDENILRLKEAYSKHFIVADKTPCAFYPGVLDTLEYLRADGHQLAVATGKSRSGLTRVLTNLKMEGFFDSTRCADETRSKPDPLMVQQILKELSVCPEYAVMVGDTEYDLNMANNANVAGVAVNYGAHSAQRLLACNPKGSIDDFPQLLDWVSQFS